MKILVQAISIYFKVLTVVSPRLAGKKAFKLLQRPRAVKLRKREKEFYENSEVKSIKTAYGNIPLYENGIASGRPVLLVHGWESNAGSMFGIGNELVKRGYHVISLDLPAHGMHKAKHTNLFECKEVVKTVIASFTFTQPLSIVSHSFGTAVAAYALSELDHEIDQFVALTGPNKLSSLFEVFKDMFDLPQVSYGHLVKHVEPLFGKELESISIDNVINKASYRQLTLIHNPSDKIIPYSDSEEIVSIATNSELITIKDSGHYRMLWSEEVYGYVTNRLENSFVDDSAGAELVDLLVEV